MELRIYSTSLRQASHSSLYHPFSSKWFFFNSHSVHHRINLLKKARLNPNLKPLLLRVSLSWDKVSSMNGNPIPQNSFQDSPQFVEVIGIGSRKDAVLDFCLDSPFLSSSSRFWNILIKDSMKVQLQQRFSGKDIAPMAVEAPLAFQSCSKAVILVASAAYGSDHMRVADILKRVKSANGLAVGIILKPFSFEGRRRKDEVKDLVEKLQQHTNFCIVIDTDLLLEKDLVTLDEALKTANNAVLMAINAISTLISGKHKKFLDSPQNSTKELKVSEAIKILESYKEVKIGFGAGYNIQTSIMRAIYDCPFLGFGLKDLDGTVICILASSAVINSRDVNAFLHTFRQTTECRREIVISTVHEPNRDPGLIMATVITAGHIRHQASQESSIFTRLAQHFPFIFNLLRRQPSQYDDTQESYLPENLSVSEVTNSQDWCEVPNVIPVDGMAEGFGFYSAELQTLFSNNSDEIDFSSEQEEVEVSETAIDSSNFYDPNTEGAPAFQRESLIRQSLGPANDSGATPTLDNLSIYRLPVGVKPSEELKNILSISNTVHLEKVTGDDMKAQTQITPRMSWDALTDAGFEVVSEFYDNASALLKGNDTDVSKKQGVLSVRAASMLEAERETQKKWNPIVEMKYRGGTYKGRCQGGLPEGKGRLSLGDGSIYDGMWHYGKRSGLGTLYFRNGDVFQGSWRDDVMHGKGWLYFHTGDRWFVNFWKGKANGEGRFYSKCGEIFFGHFKDGWRHGHFLCINVDGARCLEIWDEGVLVSRKQLDSDDAGAE
ncbi:hypothetical protein ACSBR2_005836 [Camellia fascicularis]